ncbi:hypothetical protein Hanom_Chr16g01450251 [Helianthus anomalus]
MTYFSLESMLYLLLSSSSSSPSYASYMISNGAFMFHSRNFIVASTLIESISILVSPFSTTCDDFIEYVSSNSPLSQSYWGFD